MRGMSKMCAVPVFAALAVLTIAPVSAQDIPAGAQADPFFAEHQPGEQESLIEQQQSRIEELQREMDFQQEQKENRAIDESTREYWEKMGLCPDDGLQC